MLEASAGTGKTTTIAVARRPVRRRGRRPPARAAARDVRPAGHLRAARARPRPAGRGRARAAHGRPAGRRPGRRAARRAPTAQTRAARLTVALAEFDAATITTTHGFCQQMLTSLGTIGDVEPDARLVPDIAALEAEVVDDLYLRKYEDSRRTDADGRRTPARSRTRRSATPPPRSNPPTPGRVDARATPTAWPTPHAPSCSAASARSTCSTTTTCWSSCGTRSPTSPRRPRSGSGRGTASSWSTSSRTPTPCSGTSCAPRSTSTARSC